MRRRAGAIIIRNKKILMLTGDGKVDFYWTPGGKLQDGESYEDALVREIDEELHVSPSNLELYCRFSSPEEVFNGYTAPESEDEYFLLETEDEIKIDAEIKKAVWVTKEELLRLPLLQKFKLNVVDKLIENGLL